MDTTNTPVTDKAAQAEPMANFTASGDPDPKAASTSYNLDGFKADASHEEMVNAETDFTVVKVTKPAKESWVWVMPKPWHFPGYIHITDFDQTTYLLTPAAVRSLDPTLVKRVGLTAYTDRFGVWALWPVPMVNEDGSTNPWHVSAREIAFGKTERWLRVLSSRHHGAYLTIPAPSALPAPKMPPVDMAGLVSIAFRDRLISDPGHEVLRRARGEVV